MLAETASRAASQHEVYQELMLTPTGKDLETLAKSLGWNDDFSVMQQKLLAEWIAADFRDRQPADPSRRSCRATRS